MQTTNSDECLHDNFQHKGDQNMANVQLMILLKEVLLNP